MQSYEQYVDQMRRAGGGSGAYVADMGNTMVSS